MYACHFEYLYIQASSRSSEVSIPNSIITDILGLLDFYTYFLASPVAVLYFSYFSGLNYFYKKAFLLV